MTTGMRRIALVWAGLTAGVAGLAAWPGATWPVLTGGTGLAGGARTDLEALPDTIGTGFRQTRQVEIAVTLDDLPWMGSAASLDAVATGTRRMLDALAERAVRAAGFVVCDGMRAHPGIAQAWQAAGHDLGNHSGQHGDLDVGPVSAWLEDVRRCAGELRAALGEVDYFRYPMLHQGATTDRRAAAAALLRELGYRNAPVSIDNSEWVVAQAWADAEQQGDDAVLARIRSIYFDHVRRAVAHARETARARFGREVRHVLLLHANALNAANLGALLDTLALDGARYIPLDSALADPVYALPDDYIGPRGLSWLYRVRPADAAAGSWDAGEEARVRAALAAAARR